MSNPTNHAFPTGSWEYDGNGTVLPYQEPGLSKRELFAAMAMQGLLANPGGPIQANGMSGWALCNCTEDDVVGTSLSLADALIAALNKEPTP